MNTATPPAAPPPAAPPLPPPANPRLRRMANALRALAMDAVEKANSGHPGMPMGMADAATVLFTQFLKFDPLAPDWPDRDRFVLSAGHGSMLLYGLLHLLGYPDMTLDELKRFRQLGSRTAGHPERGLATRHRDDDRAARPGSRQFGRHGARRTASRRRIRRRSRQSLYLCDLRRRLPDGRDQPRGDLAGRPSAAQQADRAVGRQFDHDRRRHRAFRCPTIRSSGSARMAGRPSASTGSTMTRSPPRSAGRRRTTGRA